MLTGQIAIYMLFWQYPHNLRQPHPGAFVKETMLPNSPAIPLPIPLPAGPVKPDQPIDLHEINDI
jgi:hypothetical protein